MLDTLLARNMIDKLSQFTKYNLNIMDEKGIIIASRTKARIGSFHEIAYQIIKGNEDVIYVEKDMENIGVKSGVNMAIYFKNMKVGVIGITGEPAEITSIAQIIKMSLEIMMEYEQYKFDHLRRRNMKEQLLNLLIYSDNVTMGDLNRYIHLLQLNINIYRVPILIHIEKMPDNMENILSTLRNSDNHSKQDLLTMTQDNDVIIYKALENQDIFADIFESYSYYIGEYLSPILRYLRNNNLKYKVFIGLCENNFRYYKQGYQHCIWMKKNVVNGHKESYYFIDYIQNYLDSLIPLNEYHAIYSALKELLDDKFIERYLETMEALIETDFNLNNASNVLHIHKNTLVYRLNSIKDIIHMNPFSNDKQRNFLRGFYNYLKIVSNK